MTTQQQLKATLEKTGLPFHEIAVYGSQITVEARSQDTCRKWGHLLGKFAKVKGMVRSVAYTKDQSQRTTVGPQTFEIWRVYATI